jgi:5'-nucleotidase
MPFDLNKHLVIGISSRALFDLEMENKLFEEKGLAEYNQYQNEHQEDILKPGTGYRLVKKLLQLNNYYEGDKKIEVIVMTKNYAEISLRYTQSIEHYGLDIRRSVWTGGTPITKYLKPFKVDLFLSANSVEVQEAIKAGFAAARIYDFPNHEDEDNNDPIRIAFDGDAVLFSDESEKIYKEGGIEAFLDYEIKNAKKLLPEGPFARLLKAISYIHKKFDPKNSPIRLGLVTSRGSDTHERVIRTLRNWNVRIDEAFFLGGIEKYEVLQAFGADIFFDDQDLHCSKSSKVVPTALVPYGTRNED